MPTIDIDDGEPIDDYLPVEGGTYEVPQGTYEYGGDALDADYGEDTTIEFNGSTLRLQDDHWRETIEAEDGATVTVRNFTLRGQVEEKSRFRLEARAGAEVHVHGAHFPDGSTDGADSRPFYSPPEHAGVVRITNCSWREFSNNGAYVDSPGKDRGEDGRVTIENCKSVRTNIAGFRVGSSESVVRNCVVYNDRPSPANYKDKRNMRGIRVRSPGADILIEDCDLYYGPSTGGSGCIVIHDGAEGGSGTVRNCRIHNDSDTTAIRAKGDAGEGWTVEDVYVTGDGDRTVDDIDDADVETGDDTSRVDAERDPTGDGVSTDPPDSDPGGDRDEYDGDVFEVVSQTDDAELFYRFAAAGDVEPVELNDRIRAGHGDQVVDDGGPVVVEGYTGNDGYGDGYELSGDLLWFEVDESRSEADYVLRLNGEQIDPEEYERNDGDGSDGDTPGPPDREFGGYATPQRGTADWHEPLNENFTAIDADVRTLAEQVAQLRSAVAALTERVEDLES